MRTALDITFKMDSLVRTRRSLSLALNEGKIVMGGASAANGVTEPHRTVESGWHADGELQNGLPELLSLSSVAAQSDADSDRRQLHGRQ
jgi:hypothetical protein